MQTDQYPDSHIFIALVLAAIAAVASTPRAPAVSFGFSAIFPSAYSPAAAFGEAIPWEPTADETDLTAPP